MKKILAILLSLLTLLSCGFLSACSAEKTQPDTPDTETVWEMVSEAYIYAFPLVLTDATKTLSTNTDGTMTGRAPINQFNHAKKLADASFSAPAGAAQTICAGFPLRKNEPLTA